VATAAQLVTGAGELVAAFAQPAWVAEEPERHLGPHVEDWCRQDGRLAVSAAFTDDRGSYVVDLRWRGGPGGVGQVRAAVFSLIGSFAESATYVRQRRIRDEGDARMELRFDVGTGEVARDASFQPHGHVVEIVVTSAPRPEPSASGPDADG
jgi:hypothetical protein